MDTFMMQLKQKGIALALALLVLAGSLTGCNKAIRMGKESPDKPSPEAVFFPKFVAGKLTQKLQEVVPDTFATVKANKILPLGDLTSILIENKYQVGGIKFTEEEGKVGAVISYDLEQFFLFAKDKLKDELANKGKASTEVVEALDLSLDILFAYYESKAKLPTTGELKTVFPHSDAETSQVFLSKLNLLYFQVETGSNDGAVTLKMGWDAEKFKVFLTDVLAGKYKVVNRL